MVLSLFAKLRNKYFQEFIRTWGREPQTPREWMEIQNLAVRELNKTKGVPSGPKKPWHQGWKPEVIQGGKGIESLLESGAVKKGVAPKTTIKTLADKKERHTLLKDAEEGIARIKRENKQAVRDFEKKFGKKKTTEDFRDEGDWDPGGMASGGRIGYAGGQLVKGARWFLKSLKDTKKQVAQLDLPIEKKTELLKQADDAILHIESGGPIPEQIIQHIRKDPKFRSVSQGPRSGDPDLAEMEEVILEYGQRHASGGLAYMLGEPNTRTEALREFGVVTDPWGMYTDPSLYTKGERPSGAPQRAPYSQGGVGHGPWTTGIVAPTPDQGQDETPVPQVASKPNPLKAPRGLPSVAPKNMDPAYIQQQMMQQAMMGQGPRPMAAEGGRIGFDKGKKVDLSKRRFLKGTGAAVGLLSMLPFVGKFFKPAAKALGKFKGTPNLVVDITKTPNMPEWYIPLIKKVLNKGDEITDTAATVERQRVHRDILPDGDEVIVTQNIDNQTIGVHVVNPKDGYRSASGAGEQPYQIQYSKGKVIEEGKMKGQKEPDKLEVDEPYVAHRGPDDSEIEFDIMDYNPKAEVHDTSVLESYATGKKVKSRGTGEVTDPYEGYSPDLKDPDIEYAKGGLAYMLGE